MRIIHGQVFARDFFEVVGPGTLYWLAIFLKLFGVTFVATRICLLLMSLGTGLLVYFLSCKVCRTYCVLPCLLVAGTSFGMLWPAISHHVDSNLFALLLVACMVLWSERHNNAALIAAGILAGATTCFLQTKGILLLASILLWLWIQRQRRAAPISGTDLSSWEDTLLSLHLYWAILGVTAPSGTWPTETQCGHPGTMVHGIAFPMRMA